MAEVKCQAGISPPEDHIAQRDHFSSPVEEFCAPEGGRRHDPSHRTETIGCDPTVEGSSWSGPGVEERRESEKKLAYICRKASLSRVDLWYICREFIRPDIDLDDEDTAWIIEGISRRM